MIRVVKQIPFYLILPFLRAKFRNYLYIITDKPVFYIHRIWDSVIDSQSIGATVFLGLQQFWIFKYEITK